MAGTLSSYLSLSISHPVPKARVRGLGVGDLRVMVVDQYVLRNGVDSLLRAADLIIE